MKPFSNFKSTSASQCCGRESDGDAQTKYELLNEKEVNIMPEKQVNGFENRKQEK